MKRKIISAVLVVCMLMTCVVTASYTASAATANEYSEISANPNNLATSNDDATILQAWNWSYTNIESKLDKIADQGFTTIQISPPNEIKNATAGAYVTQSNNQNGWWMFYQPAGFQINESTDNALGTKSELIKMVKAAHAKGIKVIADTVINHMGTKDNENSETSTDPMAHVTPKAAIYEPEIYNNKLFHTPWKEMTYYETPAEGDTNAAYNSAYDLTRNCTSRLPDLKTEDSRVQKAVYDYLQELVDCGIDGFRIDAVKHIETPNDVAGIKSDFLPNTFGKIQTYALNTHGKELLTYGEILNTCGIQRSYQDYTPYMKITDSSTYRGIFANVDGGAASDAIPANMTNDNSTKDQVVLWNESHDTFTDGETRGFSTVKRNKTWAVMASRDGITSMYLARPDADPNNLTTVKLGDAGETDWANKEVKEVNKFSNIFTGQAEDNSTGSNIAVIGRGSKTSEGGAVLVNCSSGGTKSAANVPTKTLADGSYTDHVSGNVFTVSNGKVTSGTIGATGIAVLYHNVPRVSGTASTTYMADSINVNFRAVDVDYATYSVNNGSEKNFTYDQKVTFGTSADTEGATYKVTLKGYKNGEVAATQTYSYSKVNPESTYTVTLNTNGNSGWSTPYVYYWNSVTNNGPKQWPGQKMTASNGVFTASFSSTYNMLIFNDGNNTKQTGNITITRSSIYTLTSSSGLYTSQQVGPPADKIYYPGATEATEFTSEYSFGDVDRNGKVNINDVTMIQQRLVFLVSFDVEQANLADFNRDGKLNIHDATCIQYDLAGKSIT